MLGTYFYHEILRKTVIGFGTLFNNINIRHTDASGTNVSTMKVPLAYGPMQKFLARIQQQPELEREIAITLPRLSFEMQGLQYDPTRKTGIAQTFLSVSGGTAKKVYMPVPYNVSFELSIMSKLSDDALQILEQILPFFQPSFSMSLKFIPDMDEVRDVAVVLNSVDFDDDWEDDFSTRRSITYTMQFTAKSYIYGPYTKADVIRKSRIIETIGDTNVNKRHVELSYTPKAKTDINQDGQVTAADDALVTADDDFGFNEGMTFL